MLINCFLSIAISLVVLKSVSKCHPKLQQAYEVSKLAVNLAIVFYLGYLLRNQIGEISWLLHNPIVKMGLGAASLVLVNLR